MAGKGLAAMRKGPSRKLRVLRAKENRRRIMIKQITIIAGLLLSVAGVLGLAAPNFMGLSLSSGQGILYFSSGGLALLFGLLGPPAESRMFAIILGGFYGVLGVAGLGLGGPVLTIIPGQLVFETLDHL